MPDVIVQMAAAMRSGTADEPAVLAAWPDAPPVYQEKFLRGAWVALHAMFMDIQHIYVSKTTEGVYSAACRYSGQDEVSTALGATSAEAVVNAINAARQKRLEVTPTPSEK